MPSSRARGRNSFSSPRRERTDVESNLVEMDGFTKNDNVIVMAATNRGGHVGSCSGKTRVALIDVVQVTLPDLKERHILKFTPAIRLLMPMFLGKKSLKEQLVFLEQI